MLFFTLWCGRRDLNPHGLPHYHLKVACMPISPRPHMYRWVIKDSNLSLFIQFSEETHPPYTGSDTHSGYFRSFYSHSSLHYLSAPCGSTHMYSRLVICLAGLRHPIRLIAQDIAFMVGGAGIEPAEPKHLIYSQARCPLRNTHRYVTRLQYMFFNKGKEIITMCCWSLYMAPCTGFEPATPSGHGFQDRFLTTRTHGI